MNYATAMNDPRPLRPLNRDQAQAALNLKESRDLLDKADRHFEFLKKLAAGLGPEQQKYFADCLDDLRADTFAGFQGDLS